MATSTAGNRLGVPSVIAEGFAREVINKVQNMRKTSGFEVTDKIDIAISSEKVLTDAVKLHEKLIGKETLAETIDTSDDAIDGTEWNINGKKAVIAVTKINS